MLKGFKPRLYQQTILATAVRKNTMVVLPTGLGKTFIFLMLAALRLKQFPKSKVLMLAPTKPLAQQHLETAKKNLELDTSQLCLLTGEIPPVKREALWQTSRLIFSTPQTIENDIISNRIQLSHTSLVCFDECHRAVGEYSYVYIAKQYITKAKYPRILGLTASPGSDIEKISEVAKNLYIEDIEVRTYKDPDVKPYIKEIKIRIVEVELPERFKLVKSYLEKCYKKKLEKAASILSSKHMKTNISKKQLLELLNELHRQYQNSGNKLLLKPISLTAEALKIHHALELLETQGSFALHQYLTKLQEQAKTSRVKAVKNLVADEDFKAALYLTEQLVEDGLEHPKINSLIELVANELSKNPNSKIIVFNQYRDSAKRLEASLAKLTNAKPKLFVGQAKKLGTGMSQKKQKEILDAFREGKFNVLISTSIGEEGLDIPKVDLVVFYEPVPSAIRSIQRRGRTGRQKQGRVVVLVTKFTRDMAYKWSSYHKERRMYRLLKDIKNKLQMSKSSFNEREQQSSLNLFRGQTKQNTLSIIADHREKGSLVLKQLAAKNIAIQLRQLEVADYICSKDVGVELKNWSDFITSIMDRRLLLQAKALSENFTKPVLIVMQDIATGIPRRLSTSAICGALTSVALGYRVPVIYTRTPKEAAELLYSFAKREQENNSNELNLHFNKPLTLKEQQEYLVSALPGIGPKLAKPLLRHFRTIRRLTNSSEDELRKVQLIGEKKARAISDLFSSVYPEKAE